MNENKAPKTLLDKNGKVISKNSIVRYKDGWVRVSAIFILDKTVNLSGVFNGKIYHKRVSLDEIYEDNEAWYAAWSKSESYQSM